MSKQRDIAIDDLKEEIDGLRTELQAIVDLCLHCDLLQDKKEMQNALVNIFDRARKA